MSVCNLSDYRERQRAAAESAYAEIERQVFAARDAIMAQGLRRLAAADPHTTLETAVERLGRIWREAWPY